MTQVAHLHTHTEVRYHRISLFCNSFQVIKRSCGYFFEDKIFGCTPAKCSAHFIQHLFSCSNLSFFRQVPCGTECPSTWNNCYFQERISMFQKPTYRSMSCFMEGDGSLFIFFDHLIFLFQSTDDPVHS